MLGLVDDEQGDLLDAAQCSAFSGAEEDTRPVAEAYLLFAGGRLMPWSGSTRPLISGLSTIAHMLSNVSLMTLKCCAVHTMRMPGGSGGAVDRDPADVVVLPVWAGSTARRCGRSEAVGAFRGDNPVDLPLPDVEPVARRRGAG